MEYDDIYDDNKEKIAELQEHCRWAAMKFMDQCWSEGVYFRITEAFRTQERQNGLYKIGRRGVKGEKPVTWTKNSKHTQRLAIDIIPVPNGYADRAAYGKISEIAAIYGITHPLSGDLPHFEFDDARQPIPPLSVLLRKTLREITTASGALLRMLKRRLRRIADHLDEGEK